MNRELKIQTLAIVVLLTALVAVALRPSHILADDDGYQYQQVDSWGLASVGGVWGVMSAVGVDSHDNVYAFKRADPGQKETEAMHSKIMVFDPQGKLTKSWGENFVISAHGLRVDNEDHVWVTDKTGDQVFKFSPNGDLLLSIGQKGVAGDNDSTEALNGPSDVVIGKDGDIFVSDGESKNTRVVKFSKDGKFIKFWGSKGSGDGELNLPHSIAIDAEGRLYVSDRSNKRIEVFDQDGKYLSQMTQFGTPACVFITKDDVMYVAAGAPDNWVMVATVDGKVLGKISGLNGPHWVAADSTGAVYVAEVGGMSLKKFIRK